MKIIERKHEIVFVPETDREKRIVAQMYRKQRYNLSGDSLRLNNDFPKRLALVRRKLPKPKKCKRCGCVN